jgi:hypothetical protein
MKSISGRDFARIIERRGWTLLRVNGSHHIYGKQGSISTANRAASSGFRCQSTETKPLKIGLLRHLTKLAELSDDDLT